MFMSIWSNLDLEQHVLCFCLLDFKTEFLNFHTFSTNTVRYLERKGKILTQCASISIERGDNSSGRTFQKFRESMFVERATTRAFESSPIKSSNDHGYVSLVVNTSRSFPHSSLITRLVTRLTRQVPLVKQELLTLPEHMSSPPVLSGVCVA